MDGVFMKKILQRVAVCGLIAAVFWFAFLVSDRNKLDNTLIRFHVVANSDSEEDQSIKLKVRDLVLESIESDLQKITNIEDAKAYLHQNLPKIQQVVDQTLETFGFSDGASVSLCKESFETRHYDTFSLPAGVYDTLRIVIGEGLGQNWWCVSFPSLCIPATASGFADTAVSAGFSETLVQTLSGNEDYEIRFFFLNQLGKLENILFEE